MQIERTTFLLFAILFLNCGDGTSDFSNVLETFTCGSNPGAQKITHAGEEREYLIFIPPAYDENSPSPLFLNFHGFGGTASGHVKAADMRKLSESENFILVYPQGSCSGGSPHWNPSLPSPENKSDADDLGFVEALVAKISSEYTIDPKKVYAAGYSNGGMLAYGLACYKSDLISAAVSMSGAMLDIDCEPTQSTSVMIVHGTKDEVLPYEGSVEISSVEDVLGFWTSFNQTEAPIRTSEIFEGLSIEHSRYEGKEGVAVEHYKVNEGDHIWFDFDFEGVDLNRLIWNFCSGTTPEK